MGYSKAIKDLKVEWPGGSWTTSEGGNDLSGEEYVVTGEVGGLKVELWSEWDSWFAVAGRGVCIAERSKARDTPAEAVKRALYLAR